MPGASPCRACRRGAYLAAVVPRLLGTWTAVEAARPGTPRRQRCSYFVVASRGHNGSGVWGRQMRDPLPRLPTVSTSIDDRHEHRQRCTLAGCPLRLDLFLFLPYHLMFSSGPRGIPGPQWSAPWGTECRLRAAVEGGGHPAAASCASPLPECSAAVPGQRSEAHCPLPVPRKNGAGRAGQAPFTAIGHTIPTPYWCGTTSVWCQW